jgi:hypothetical protein
MEADTKVSSKMVRSMELERDSMVMATFIEGNSGSEKDMVTVRWSIGASVQRRSGTRVSGA